MRRKMIRSFFTAWLVLSLPFLSPAAPEDDPIEVDLWLLTSIEYEEGKPLPTEIQKLDGKRIVITGYMDPIQETPEPIKDFRLITQSCGCEGVPKPHHFVEVTLDKEILFITELVRIVGTLSVGELKEDGFVVSLYRLTAESIE